MKDMHPVHKAFRHYFTPHEKNNYRARLLHIQMLAAYLTVFVITGFVIKQVEPVQSVLGYATDISINKLYQLTNTERQKAGLNTLSYNTKLEQAAQKKADDMFARNYWAHYGPDGTTPWKFILDSGYNYEYAGENLAKNFMFSDGVVEAWMKSPTHRENMLRKEYTEIGFATKNGMLNGEETTLVVQMFGTPLGQSVPLIEKKPDPPVQAKVDIKQVQNVQAVEKPKVLSTDTTYKSPAPSLTRWLYNGNLIFLVLLIVVLALDLFIATKMDIIHLRVTGKSLIHIMFLAFIVGGILLIAKGHIL
jgi:hypothetical protein